MKKGYQPKASKGFAKDVNVVNTPTVKIDHGSVKPSLPNLRLTTEILPELKDWKVGNKYTLTLEVEQTSMSKGDEFALADSSSGSNSNQTSGSFKVLSVKAS